MKHDLGKIQKLAATALGGEVVLIAGNGIVVKQSSPTWADKPYVTSNICYQKDSVKHEYSFHTSTYDQTLDQVRKDVRDGLHTMLF
jgi:hypothetical protein